MPVSQLTDQQSYTTSFGSQDKQLAESCSGIHIILGGHDHDPYYLTHRGVLIIKCGQNAVTSPSEYALCSR